MFNKQWPKLKKHLFNIRLDPEERNDLTLARPDVVEQLREKVVELLHIHYKSEKVCGTAFSVKKNCGKSA